MENILKAYLIILGRVFIFFLAFFIKFMHNLYTGNLFILNEIKNDFCQDTISCGQSIF
jgi:hypothetical protein